MTLYKNLYLLLLTYLFTIPNSYASSPIDALNKSLKPNALFQPPPSVGEPISVGSIIQQNEMANKENQLSIENYTSRVSDLRQIWNANSLQYYRNTALGPVLGRYNFASRLGTTSSQFQIEAYPKLSTNNYAHVEFAYSGGLLFPKTQCWVEGFHTLPKNHVISVGVRQLNYLNAHLTLVTGSASRLINNYWLSIRPTFFVPVHGGKTFLTEVVIRRYFSTETHFISLIIAGGTAPELAEFNFINYYEVGNVRALLLGQFPLNDTFVLKVGVGYERDRFPTGTERRQPGGLIGIAAFF